MSCPNCINNAEIINKIDELSKNIEANNRGLVSFTCDAIILFKSNQRLNNTRDELLVVEFKIMTARLKAIYLALVFIIFMLVEDQLLFKGFWFLILINSALDIFECSPIYKFFDWLNRENEK